MILKDNKNEASVDLSDSDFIHESDEVDNNYNKKLLMQGKALRKGDLKTYKKMQNETYVDNIDAEAVDMIEDSKPKINPSRVKSLSFNLRPIEMKMQTSN